MTLRKFAIVAGILFGVIYFNVRARSPVTRVLKVPPVQDGQFSYQAQFGYVTKPGYLCGATVIDRYHIITAAHCVYIDELNDAAIAVGSVKLTNLNEEKKIYQVNEAYISDIKNVSMFDTNIAILRIKGNFTFNDFVGPVEVRTKPVKEANCVSTGWGINAAMGGSQPGWGANDTLHMKLSPLIDTEVCREKFYRDGFNITSEMLCAGFIDGKEFECKGDFGGPLVCDGQLTGVVSFNEGCVLTNLPGVYTDIAYMSRWIRSTLIRSYEEAGIQEQVPISEK